MEKNLSEDNDSSFEVFDPTVISIQDSMSIVAIPEENRSGFDPNVNYSQQLNDMSNRLSSNRLNSFNVINDNDLDTKRMDSEDNDLPSYEQIEAQNRWATKISNLPNDVESNDERKASLKTLSDNLNRIESNIQNNSNTFADISTNDLETYLREMRAENEKLKADLERINTFMKSQLKHLHESQLSHNSIVCEHKQLTLLSKQLSEENHNLKEENSRLKDRVSQLDGKADSSQLLEQMSTEVATLRAKCEQLSTYDKMNFTSELKSQELSSHLVESQLKSDGLTNELNALKAQLRAANSQLEGMAAMGAQLRIYERDFKMEEMAKEAALKEVSELEDENEKLKKRCADMEEKLETGEPVVDLKQDLMGTKRYTCPKCWCSFERFQAIQDHFERCLDEDGLFT